MPPSLNDRQLEALQYLRNVIMRCRQEGLLDEQVFAYVMKTLKIGSQTQQDALLALAYGVGWQAILAK